MRQQQRMKNVADMTRKSKANGRMYLKNSWWASEMLAAECRKTWLHPAWEDTMQRWQNWLYEIKKKDEEKTHEEEQQKLASRMIASAEGGAGLLHKVTKPTVWREGLQILNGKEEDIRPLARCEEKRNE